MAVKAIADKFFSQKFTLIDFEESILNLCRIDEKGANFKNVCMFGFRFEGLGFLPFLVMENKTLPVEADVLRVTGIHFFIFNPDLAGIGRIRSEKLKSKI